MLAVELCDGVGLNRSYFTQIAVIWNWHAFRLWWLFSVHLIETKERARKKRERQTEPWISRSRNQSNIKAFLLLASFHNNSSIFAVGGALLSEYKWATKTIYKLDSTLSFVLYLRRFGSRLAYTSSLTSSSSKRTEKHPKVKHFNGADVILYVDWLSAPLRET